MLGPVVHWYKLDTIRLCVTTPDAALGGFLDWLLGPPAFDAPGAAAPWQVHIDLTDTVPDAAPEFGDVIWAGDLPDGCKAAIYDNGTDRSLVVRGLAAVAIKRHSKTIGILVLRGRENILHDNVAAFVVSEIIRASGRFLVHAACLLHPSQDECLLIFAPSGTGKTTTSLALARSGWRLIGDDATVLERAGHTVMAWALPRALNIHRNTEALLPWLTTATGDWGSRDVQSVTLEGLSQLVRHAIPVPRPCRIIGLLDPPNGTRHRIARLDRSEAVFRILKDNLRVFGSGLTADDIDLLDCLACLTRHTTVLRLSVGPQLDTLSSSLATGLQH